MANYREGFDASKFGERYTDILAKYDYIVGDWGYEQLRLKGFFYTKNRKSSPDQKINMLEDYLYEYCNFGCAYFVVECVDRPHTKTKPNRRHKKTHNKKSKQAHVAEKKDKSRKKSRQVNLLLRKNRQKKNVLMQKWLHKKKQKNSLFERKRTNEDGIQRIFNRSGWHDLLRFRANTSRQTLLNLYKKKRFLFFL